MKHFRSLEIHIRSAIIKIQIWQLVKSFPPNEKYRLTDQIIRSTRKCAANIAEGHGRFHWQESIQFSRIARASLSETQDHLDTALECEDMEKEVWQKLDRYIEQTIKMINGYIRHLENQKKEQTTK